MSGGFTTLIQILYHKDTNSQFQFHKFWSRCKTEKKFIMEKMRLINFTFHPKICKKAPRRAERSNFWEKWYFYFFQLYWDIIKVYNVVFICISWQLVMTSILMYLLDIPFGKNIYSSSLPIFELSYFCCWVLGVLDIFWISVTY